MTSRSVCRARRRSNIHDRRDRRQRRLRVVRSHAVDLDRHARRVAHVAASRRQIRMALTPLLNHWWNVPLYVSSRGLTTSLMHTGGRGHNRRPNPTCSPGTSIGRGLLCRDVGRARGPRRPRHGVPAPIGGGRGHPVRSRPTTPLLRPRRRPPSLVGARTNRPRVDGVPGSLHRQGLNRQPRAPRRSRNMPRPTPRVRAQVGLGSSSRDA